jgi:acyl-CoA synthetase (AMP-forming)/AMP-acid ligase II/outer membrane protein assembly factor BamB
MTSRIRDDESKKTKGKEDHVVASSNIVDLFDELCFSFGEDDAIHVIQSDDSHNSDDDDGQAIPVQQLFYAELQEYSKNLAFQLHWRYRPSFVLVDCHGWPGAEVVAMMACMRCKVPFVPVSCHSQHAGKGRLGRIVQQLQQAAASTNNHKHSERINNKQGGDHSISIVALTCCKDDQDPVLGVLKDANLHSILFLDPTGNLREPLDVPSYLPEPINRNGNCIDDDNLYILFTSGTSGEHPKAVIGSHRSTLKRIQWFQETLEPLPRVAKRTPLTFVDAIAELLGTLLTRQSLLVTLEPNRFVVDVGTIVTRTECSQISLLPSQLSQLLQYLQGAKVSDSHPATKISSSLQRIIVSGEPCSEQLWKSFQQIFFNKEKCQFTCQLINLYGQTETTGDCCGAILTDLEEKRVVVNHTVTIGKPLRIEITIHHPAAVTRNVDDHHPVVSNVLATHELIVSGADCFANGYLGMPLSAGGFIAKDDGVTPKIVSFATKDAGFCQDGYWYAQGRCDDIEKIDGVWTSPSEVETAFLAYVRISTTAATTMGPLLSTEAAAAAIIDHMVYIMAELASTCSPFVAQEDAFSRQDMRERTGLPWNLIPHQVFACESLPRTASTGKVDRARVKQILRELIRQHRDTISQQLPVPAPPTNSIDSSRRLFQFIVSSVLSPGSKHDGPYLSVPSKVLAPEHKLDTTKSFLDLGGTSASSVSLLYQLRLHWKPPPEAKESQEANNDVKNQQSINRITASDILNANSLNELWEQLVMPSHVSGDRGTSTSKKLAKRPKHKKDDYNSSGAFSRNFVPEPVTTWSFHHVSVEFAACVDAQPLVMGLVSNPADGNSNSASIAYTILAACQNGVLQKISLVDKTPSTSLPADNPHQNDAIQVLACNHLFGWRISAHPVFAKMYSSELMASGSSTESIFVCANRHPRAQDASVPGAMVLSLSTDLKKVQWRCEFPPGSSIPSSATLFESKVFVLVSTQCDGEAQKDDPDSFDGHHSRVHNVLALNISDGSDAAATSIRLPVRVANKPVLLPRCLYSKGNGNEHRRPTVSSLLVYASCDWDTGLMLIDAHNEVLNSAEKNGRCFADSLGPIYKEMVPWDDNSIVAADSRGSLHHINISTMSCKSIKLSNKALSSPAILADHQQRKIVVGCYDGRVRCVNANMTVVLWECNVGSVVYTRPLVLSDNRSLIVCTTAGDVVQISRNNGGVIRSCRLPLGAEIWSDPVEVVKDEDNTAASRQQKGCLRIAFGARDSRLHILKILAH